MPTDRDADLAYKIIDQIAALLELPGRGRDAKELARKALRARRDRVYDRVTKGANDVTPLAEPPRRAERKREQFRRDVFERASPRRLLTPANIVAVYLDEKGVWPSWGWDDTQEINRRLLPFVQGLDAHDPIAADVRLALPFTVAGFFLYRALMLHPSSTLTADVYHEMIDGITTIDRLPVPSRALTGDFLHVADTAQLLLLHAIRFGLDAYGQGLILFCKRKAKCRKGEPFYVTSPAAMRYHGACRVAAYRDGTDVTTKGRQAQR